jgi:peptide/nickel transport system substrate-binding protein
MSILPRAVKLADAFQPSQRFPRLATLFLLVALLGSCSSAPTRAPGVVIVGLDSGPVTLDPRFATDATASQVGDLLFVSLTTIDAQARRQPWLAGSWESPDPRTYVFHLRCGFQFGDGAPLTAADVKATFDSVLDPKTASPKRPALGPLSAVKVVDAQTVRFELAEPFAPFLQATGLGILPERQVVASPTTPIAAPGGAGPFRLLELRPDDEIVLARNPHYPDGEAKLEGVVFRVVPDATTRALELARGTLDIVQNGIEPQMLPWLRRQPHLQLLQGPSTACQYIGINLRHPPLNDLRLRRALAYAVDRQAIIDGLLQGLAKPASGLLPPDHWAYSGSLQHYDYNPDMAARLLDEAGYRDPDGPGPLPRLRLSFKTSTVELRRRIAEALQAQLQHVGIALEVRSFEWATFYADVRHGSFDLFSLAWVGIEDPDIYYLTAHSSQQPPQGSNRGGLRDGVIDLLTSRARHTRSLAGRQRIYRKTQQRLAEILPIIPLWWPTNFAAVHRRLHGYVLLPNGSFASLRSAWIEPS